MKIIYFARLIVGIVCLSIAYLPEAMAAKDESGSTVHVYKAGEIGWIIQIPADWERRTDEEINAGRARGAAVIERQMNIKLPPSKTGLLYLKHKHGRVGRFTSDLSPYDLKGYKDYRELQAERFSIATKILTSQGANFSATQGQATIDGIQFQTLELRVMSPKDGSLGVLIKIYDGVVGKKSLIMSYTANPPAISESIEAAISASKFTRPRQ